MRPSVHRCLALALLVAGCDSSTAPAAGVRLALDASTVSRDARGVATLGFTVENGTVEPLQLNSVCGANLTPAIERFVANGWTQHSGGICLGIYDSSPKTLAAGAERSDAATLSEPGTYRLVLSTGRGMLVSAPFTVR